MVGWLVLFFLVLGGLARGLGFSLRSGILWPEPRWKKGSGARMGGWVGGRNHHGGQTLKTSCINIYRGLIVAKQTST